MRTYEQTERQISQLREKCVELFKKKNSEYGPTWLGLRPLALIDHILIKGLRLKTIESPEHDQQIPDSEEDELIGIANYCAMGIAVALLQGEDDQRLDEPMVDVGQFSESEVLSLIEEAYKSAESILNKKNFDYGEAWRSMEPESFTDEIILRTSRMKSIIRREGNFSYLPIVSQLHDTLNYAFFGLISRGRVK